MNTLAYVLILTGGVFVAGAARARTVGDSMRDLADVFSAVVGMDMAKAREVLSRRGDAFTPPDAPATSAAPPTESGSGVWTGTFYAYAMYLQSTYNVRIREFMPFDRVDPVHVAGSDHNKNKAMDIPMAGTTKETLDKVAADARSRKGFFVIWQAPGHYDHVHISDRR